MARVQKTSIHGKRAGLGFSDELLNNFDCVDVARINSATTSSGATLPSYGVAVLASTATAATALIPAPSEGRLLEIVITGNSSLYTLSRNATTFTIGTSSSSLTFTGAAANGLKSQFARLRGISSAAWMPTSLSSLAALS